MIQPPILRPCGDSAISVDFGDRLDPELTARVIALDTALRAAAPPGVVETVPSYRALTVYFDPLTVDSDDLARIILDQTVQRGDPTDGSAKSERTWNVPVIFGGGFGIDLRIVAEHADMSPKDFIDAFVAAEYTVAMVGFLPGFSYLSGLPVPLAIPRRADPRARIPASSVAVGGAQAALGSIEGPSGWHLLGRSPVRPYLPGRDPIFLFSSGDRLRFQPVKPDAWDGLDRQAVAGEIVAKPA